MKDIQTSFLFGFYFAVLAALCVQAAVSSSYAVSILVIVVITVVTGLIALK